MLNAELDCRLIDPAQFFLSLFTFLPWSLFSIRRARALIFPPSFFFSLLVSENFNIIEANLFRMRRFYEENETSFQMVAFQAFFSPSTFLRTPCCLFVDLFNATLVKIIYHLQ